MDFLKAWLASWALGAIIAIPSIIAYQLGGGAVALVVLVVIGWVIIHQGGSKHMGDVRQDQFYGDGG